MLQNQKLNSTKQRQTLHALYVNLKLRTFNTLLTSCPAYRNIRKSHFQNIKEYVVDKIGSKVWTNYFNNKETITELLIGPKLKNCLFPTPDRLLENVETRNIFWRDLQQLFFWVTGNRDRKFRYCSRIYVRNWFTLLNEQNRLLDFKGTRFVNERSLF